MERIALFPTSFETLPIANYINNYCCDKKITTLLAMPGTGLCGKDSSNSDDREITGMIVSESLTETQTDWDTIYIANNPEIDEFDSANDYAIRAIEEAYKLRKDVTCSLQLSGELLAKYYRIFSDAGLVFLTPDDKYTYVAKQYGPIIRPTPYTVFVGGLISEVNSFENFLSLVGALRERQNMRVLSFSTNPDSFLCDSVDLSNILYSIEYTEVEKIYMLNDCIQNHIKQASPEIILVHIDEAMLEYNENIPNGFGIYPFIISKAIAPDFFVCGIPYQLGYTDNLLFLCDGIDGKYDFGVDYFHLSNVEIDFSTSSERLSRLILHVPLKMVEEHIQKANIEDNISYGNLLIQNYFENLVKMILSDFHLNRQLTSIV
jgi:peptide maturation system protein (TIGR04066 family)